MFKLPSKVEYAALAVLELALHSGRGKTLKIREIAERQDIPEKYLVHILQTLRRGGIINSVRGAQGGYSLAKPPAKITLKDVLSLMEGAPSRDSKRGGASEVDDFKSALNRIVGEAAEKMLEELEKVNFEDLASRYRQDTLMYYI